MTETSSFVGSSTTDATTSVVGLRTADDSGLVATPYPAPDLSWSLESDRPGVLQRAYEIQVSADPSFTDVESGGEVGSDTVTDHPWPAEPLRSRAVRHWRVRVRTDLGWTEWSGPARVEAALLDDMDWTARPVHVPSDRGRTSPGPVPLLRREFALPAEPVSARLYVTSLGVHRTAINGRPVSDELLEPGWTSYPNRLLYATYDVTALLRPGPNALSAAIGDGWHRGHLTWHKNRNVYGDTSALLAQLEVTLADGTTVTVATDDRWRGGYGDLLAADLYDGCERDLRLEPQGWRLPGFDDRGWERAAVLSLPSGLTQRAHPPVRVVQVIQPKQRVLPDGMIALDAGENVTGWLRVRAAGPAGSTVTVRHAEVLDGDGRLLTSILRGARATDQYTLAGGAVDLEPEFTFHGFRYAEIDASPGATIEAVEVQVVASDLRRIGEFHCSDERVNTLYGNVVRSQRGNFLAVPTDCPQRDERLGWTGDLMAFAPTACATFDSGSFLDSWLTDLAIEQRPDGAVPMVVPEVDLGDPPPSDLPFTGSAAGWGDAATVVPAALFDAYGRRSLLGRHYAAMRAWVEFTNAHLDEDGTWSGNAQLGDWLDPAAPPEDPARATTDSAYVATAFVAHSARLLADAARELGRADDADRYAALHRRTAEAAWHKWGDHARTTQTGCALALQFGIVPTAERAAVGEALAALVRANGGRIATGFLGTPFVLPALTDTGHTAEAYQLLLNTECPGWLYQVERGATTMWERWDAIRPDGTMDLENAGTMLSFNHYAYGAVAAWLYQCVAGLRPLTPGYRTLDIAPRPGDGLTSAAASLTTPYGRASVAWSVSGTELTVDVSLPPGTTGRFSAPEGWLGTGEVSRLGAGNHRLILRPDPAGGAVTRPGP
ncbi:family 78 glycoside hydrolase catalytic domain [Streptomyces caniscabiei]|uniref:alpha-L-rhamnosidase n=1 Tax=Streptomyces caniscabiei TaxID=2746961 RepID=A0A927QHC0_9ACTN|nr:alpha-L-rhamnosidase [Streptomyces caniscabiei]MBD9726341.1 family 78 glycoside hydrolase catalytic domain [Streptomyces caniscabiei]MDX3511806.1 family 78 glycoside hydrolase catalytic domain [Streptomyces caniscabiei]MDX3719355.1 family 78 glycoside hydrolase catalytic domain [Streptomyces caniscabiei]WEO29506.1 family 78 glycoside hydrolase catalytic domain [Streptomyces caniscabiei]